MSSSNKRREMDLTKLMMSDYEVEIIGDDAKMFYVTFHGPPESLYQGFVWKVKVELPDDYPYKSPSIGFVTKIYHPNIEESGAVCLDVLNKKWSAIFDLKHVFDTFLPQLLLYPNTHDPFNAPAAVLMNDNLPAYELKVKEECVKYATPEKEDSVEEEDNASISEFI